ncbi:uroporphyrinogen-III C-methyltransferase [Alicyclobacillus mali (ex Roth et al. 2021)]|uniref:uroporphyrinogen-III C-methyltransferase n=1 Tax=Alicyclobacillus mali (ex Roth et al. 2021) TaxID=1123961 RepID=UPI001A8DEBC6
MGKGHVALVGAGPGHPGLLTQRAKGLIEQADVIVYDRLVSPRILLHARPEALLVYAGKQAACHAMPQRDIEATLIELSHRFDLVVRLKGGDPYVFGRGAEEAEALLRHGVSWEVVPGVTSAVAVPAFAGVPVTIRGVSRSFAVATGHAEDGAIEHAASAKADTLVLLMGVKELGRIARLLVERGVSPETPGVIVEWGTRSRQRKAKGRLGELAEVAKREGIGAPAVIVIGDAVKASGDLAWYETLPRFGDRVAVVASTKQEALKAAEELEAQGAEVGLFTWDLGYRVNRWELTLAVERAVSGAAVGIAFRTTLAVESWFCALAERGVDLRRLSQVRFAALDGYVADAIRRLGIDPDARTLGEIARQKVDEWWVEEVPDVPAERDVYAACRASGAEVRTLALLERRSLPEAPDAVTPHVRTLADVMREWVNEGAINEVLGYGDVQVLRPLGLAYGLEQAIRRADRFAREAERQVCGA